MHVVIRQNRTVYAIAKAVPAASVSLVVCTSRSHVRFSHWKEGNLNLQLGMVMQVPFCKEEIVILRSEIWKGLHTETWFSRSGCDKPSGQSETEVLLKYSVMARFVASSTLNFFPTGLSKG